MIKKIASYVVGISLGLLAIAPPITFDIPVMVNSFRWVHLVLTAALFGFFLLWRDIHISLKILVPYLFLNCFFSQDPSASFNTYILIVACAYFFQLAKRLDFSIIVGILEAVFWVEVAIMLVQYFGKDTLMDFGSSFSLDEKGNLVRNTLERFHMVYFGTVFQQMRLASFFAILSPFLLMRNRWYIVPIAATCVMLGTLGYTFAIAAGVAVYVLLAGKNARWWVIAGAISFSVFCALRVNHIQIELKEGRWPVWGVILRTWCFDTTQNFHGFKSALNPAVQSGPFDALRFFLGHGMETFMTLFPYYKYDPNPFPNAHNDFLQVLWQVGLIGFLLGCVWYLGHLVKKCWYERRHEELAGIAIVLVNMFFAFPFEMTQTVLLIDLFAAYCDSEQWGVSRRLYAAD